MKIITNINELKELASGFKKTDKTIGFVPTMGALHAGHMSLVRQSKKDNDATVVSIFVNPKQFGSSGDLSKYPRQVEHDQEMLNREKVDFLFLPEAELIYPAGYQTYVTVKSLSDIIEGMSRPGHYTGVATVVLKLFNMVQPTNAYFGQKDYQQCVVMKKMVTDLNLPVKIHVVETVRDRDGLALSSRNVFLNKAERLEAVALYKSLSMAKSLIIVGEKNTQTVVENMKDFLKKYKQISLDYIAICDTVDLSALDTIKGKVVILIAAYVGKTRLIDNMIINPAKTTIQTLRTFNSIKRNTFRVTRFMTLCYHIEHDERQNSADPH